MNQSAIRFIGKHMQLTDQSHIQPHNFLMKSQVSHSMMCLKMVNCRWVKSVALFYLITDFTTFGRRHVPVDTTSRLESEKYVYSNGDILTSVHICKQYCLTSEIRDHLRNFMEIPMTEERYSCSWENTSQKGGFVINIGVRMFTLQYIVLKSSKLSLSQGECGFVHQMWFRFVCVSCETSSLHFFISTMLCIAWNYLSRKTLLLKPFY